MSELQVLNVLLYGEVIGTLTLLSLEQTVFAFNENYINNPKRPILSLSFKDQFGELNTDIRPTKVKLSPFFSNLLPEGHLRQYLAKLANVNEQREFHLIAALGQDLPGAITIAPEDSLTWSDNYLDPQSKNVEQPVLHFSLAGVQLKFSAVMETSGGLTIPAEGVGGSWIVKLPSSQFKHVPENEFAMMSLAKEMGMDIPEIKLISLNNIHNLPDQINSLSEKDAFVIQRFDRTSHHSLVHIEDFAQIFGLYPKDKYAKGNYKNIAEVLWRETGNDGIREFICRLVFNTLIGNADMHLKNWSLIYPDRVHAQIAPGYDFVSTIAYIPDEEMALNFVKRIKQRNALSLELLKLFSAKAGLPTHLVLDSATVTVQKFKALWPVQKAHLPLSKSAIVAIEKNVNSIPLFNEIN